MKQYTISQETYESLQEMLGKLATRAAAKGIAVPIELELVDEIMLSLGDGSLDRYVTVRLPGDTATISVWQFVAVIQHEKDGQGGWRNQLRRLPGLDGVELPARFRNAGPDCEHCGTKVFRKDTYIARHVGSGEWRQFGKNCLGAVTGVGNALGILEQLERVAAAIAKGVKDDDGLPKGDPHARRNGEYVPTLDYLSQVARQVRADDGKFWGKAAAESACKEPTAYAALNALREVGWLTTVGLESRDALKPSADDAAQALVWLNWARALKADPRNDFLTELQVALSGEHLNTRSVGYAAAVVAAYRRANPETVAKPERVDAGWIGSEGAEIEVTATIKRAIERVGQFGGTGYFLSDAAGHELVWWASRSDLAEGATVTLKGRVKKHDTYTPRGLNAQPIKQTVLTNCRVLETQRSVGA